jgi:hypothetical protein
MKVARKRQIYKWLGIVAGSLIAIIVIGELIYRWERGRPWHQYASHYVEWNGLVWMLPDDWSVKKGDELVFTSDLEPNIYQRYVILPRPGDFPDHPSPSELYAVVKDFLGVPYSEVHILSEGIHAPYMLFVGDTDRKSQSGWVRSAMFIGGHILLHEGHWVYSTRRQYRLRNELLGIHKDVRPLRKRGSSGAGPGDKWGPPRPLSLPWIHPPST